MFFYAIIPKLTLKLTHVESILQIRGGLQHPEADVGDWHRLLCYINF